ncbi:hypothetical protein OVA26_15270 [Microbacterium sp. SL62]|uniref:hypothetical protein n=1 Tax=Microbacterium sp. SL62 TaxID=2995139 RepID=UPI0022739273|nr:hypothetical protein [Microbacterium sp. SL62]MCY1718296.1 hypothetical protein [Microbacterium sp. SL62]
MISRPLTRFVALLAGAVVTAAVVAGAVPANAAATIPSTSASGIQMLDADGGELQQPAPLSEWTRGATVEDSLAQTGDVLKLNTTRSTGLTARAASDGAQATIESGLFQLRDRVPIAFTGLRASCGTDGSTSVTFDTLTVDGKNVLNAAKLSAGYTVALPTSDTWGSTRLIVGERAVDRGRAQVTALRIEAEAGWSEIWRVRLGVVACAPTVPASPALVSGVTVTSPSGAALIPGAPHLEAEGSVSAQTVSGTAPASTGSDVSVAHSADGSSAVSVGSFRQVPDTSSVGEYMWSALRVYGLRLTVDADGSSRVTFADTGSAVFVNGIWINTGTDLYTGVDATGAPRVRVHLNERVAQSDGSVVITALRYEDLTGAYPAVSLGVVRWSASAGGSTPTPEPTKTTAPPLPARYAFAVDATGPSAIAPAFVAAPGETKIAHVAFGGADAQTVTDGYAGQISVRGVATASSDAAASVGVDDLVLYPGTAMEVSLRNVRLEVTSVGTTLTTGGGTVAGQAVPAGAVAAGTRFAVAGRTAVITLNTQSVDGQAQTAVALEVDDRRGLGAFVRVGVVTADAPQQSPDPGGGTSPALQPQPSGGSSSEQLSPGPIGRDDVRVAGGGAASTSGPLARTGADVSALPGLIGAGLFAAVGGAVLIVFTRRRRTRRE